MSYRILYPSNIIFLVPLKLWVFLAQSYLKKHKSLSHKKEREPFKKIALFPYLPSSSYRLSRMRSTRMDSKSIPLDLSRRKMEPKNDTRQLQAFQNAAQNQIKEKRHSELKKFFRTCIFLRLKLRLKISTCLKLFLMEEQLHFCQ